MAANATGAVPVAAEAAAEEVAAAVRAEAAEAVVVVAAATAAAAAAPSRQAIPRTVRPNVVRRSATVRQRSGHNPRRTRTRFFLNHEKHKKHEHGGPFGSYS